MLAPAQQRPRRPSLSLNTRAQIIFRHPGYPEPDNELMILPRVDRATSAGGPPSYGVHHRIALLACQVIAGNEIEKGYLALDRAGQERVEAQDEYVLTKQEYYFIVEGNEQYPIVPSFSDWQFPHHSFRQFWPPSIDSLGSTCAVTNAGYALEFAHLVPKEEHAWYKTNSMHLYGEGYADINNRANLLPLRKDIHHALDTRWFVIIPRTVTTDSSQPSMQYATHIISKSAAELWPAHHAVIVESFQGPSDAYLFARFAWAILFQVKRFLIAGRARYVIRLCEDSGKPEYKTEKCSEEELRSLYGGGGSKTATPMNKKKRVAGSVADDEDEAEGSDEDSDLSMEEAAHFWGQTYDRKKRRNQDSSGETEPEVDPDAKAHLAPDVEAELREVLWKGMPAQEDDSDEEVDVPFRLREKV